MDYDKLRPNFSQIPNVILDEWMRELDHIEFKIIMVVARKTYGWHKESDKIALSQYMEMTGASKNGVKQAIIRLIARGYIRQIVVGGGKTIAEYEIVHSKESNEEPGQLTTLKKKNRGSSGDPVSIAGRPPEPPLEGRPATPQKKDLNKESKQKVPAALITEIKVIFEKGYMSVTGKKLSWAGGKAPMYQKSVVEIALHAIDVRPDSPLEEVRDRARVLLQRIREENRRQGRKFYADMGFTPQALYTQWNKLTDTVKGEQSVEAIRQKEPLSLPDLADSCKEWVPYLKFESQYGETFYYSSTEKLNTSFVEECFKKAGYSIKILRSENSQIS